jgi:hypothetical protein
MTRNDFEKMVALLPDDALVAIMMGAEVDFLTDCPPDFGELVEVALHGQRGFSQMTPEELRKLVVDNLVSSYEDDDEVDGQAVAELIDGEVKAGRHWVETVAGWRKERDA